MKVITASSNVANKIQNNREQCMFNCEVGVKGYKEKGKKEEGEITQKEKWGED